MKKLLGLKAMKKLLRFMVLAVLAGLVLGGSPADARESCPGNSRPYPTPS